MKKEALVLGKTYVVSTKGGHDFNEGDKVTYHRDDFSECPVFKRKSDGAIQHIHVHHVKEKSLKHDMHKTYDCKVDDHLMTLKGDGTAVPFLKLSGEAYVYASDLRKMAKQLNKWAKGIEASGS